MSRTRLLIVDDHEVVRLGLKMLLSRWPDIDVVGEAASAAASLVEACRLKPDIVLMDIRLPDGSGVDACREIRAACPNTRVIFLSALADEDIVTAAVFAGADGYLLKEIGGEAIVRAIHQVAEGRAILDPAITGAVLNRLRGLATPAAAIDEPNLSPQEQRVLALVARGRTNREIADALGLSAKTIKNYLSNIFQKIQVSRRAEAAAFFARRTR